MRRPRRVGEINSRDRTTLAAVAASAPCSLNGAWRCRRVPTNDLFRPKPTRRSASEQPYQTHKLCRPARGAYRWPRRRTRSPSFSIRRHGCPPPSSTLSAPQWGRSQITWDGVRPDGTDANTATSIIDAGKTVAIPVDRFRPRGDLRGALYAVSGDGFASVNPATAGQFTAFSPRNTFAMFDDTLGKLDDRFIAQSFVLRSKPTPRPARGVRGDLSPTSNWPAPAVSSIWLNASGDRVSLGKFDVPVGPSGRISSWAWCSTTADHR